MVDMVAIFDKSKSRRRDSTGGGTSLGIAISSQSSIERVRVQWWRRKSGGDDDVAVDVTNDLRPLETTFGDCTL